MRAASAICAVVALVVCVWFALGARQAIDTQRATSIVSQGGKVTRAQEREVSSLVHSARLLNPDREPDVLLGAAEFRHGDSGHARRLLESVTRSEPKNLEAWLWLGRAWGGDVAVFQEALRRVRELEPRLPSS